MTKYKGKNIRVTEEAHQQAVNHCGKKLIVGAWVSEAIEEKLQRDQEKENVILQRYGKQKETK